jgi:hypothetical protein
MIWFTFGRKQEASEKKEKKKEEKTTPKNQPASLTLPYFFFFFVGAPCVGCGPYVDTPPHAGTRHWLWGLPLSIQASSL